MNKADLVAFVAEKANFNKKQANEFISIVIEGISSSLERGESVGLIGFGSFRVTDRAEREGRNPNTGAKMTISASKSVKFSVGKYLKERVQVPNNKEKNKDNDKNKKSKSAAKKNSKK
ncbi:MAG: HU family DNA-binding protein [Desulfobacterales bacterium]|nr:HU family DNA-binding protein [Desulfobacterales bacterium]